VVLLAAVAVIVAVLSTRSGSSQQTGGLLNSALPIGGLAVLAVGVLSAVFARSAWATAGAVLLVGGAATVYALSVVPLLGPAQNSDSILLSLPVVAASVMGVGRSSLASCLILCATGYATTEGAATLGALLYERTVVVDFTALSTLLALWLLLTVLFVARRGAVRELPELGRASFAEEGIMEETRLMAHASSLLHDTVLGDLHALAMLKPGPIPQTHLAVIQRDLELLDRSDALLLAPGGVMLPGFVGDSGVSALARVLDRIDARGLRVVVSGEPAELESLDAAAEEAIVGAIEQCLVNVAVHAGVALAELAIVAVGDEVTATISDSGVGFSASDTPSDRLGLRLSVHDRLRAVGGSVLVWSTPGAGTSVLLAVPRKSAS
jgi:signal transduction histidine kinase